MNASTARWVLAGFILGVWAFLCIYDALSTKYVVDPTLHAGAGILLGAVLSSELASRSSRRNDRDRDEDDR